MDFIETDDELAHNTYGHLAAVKQNQILGALLGAVVTVATGVYQDYSSLGALYHAPKFKVEADYAGVYLAARAGYDVGCVSAFWEKMVARNPGAAWAASLTHPDGSSRLHVLDATAAEIHRKRENGRALVPNLKGTLEASDQVDVESFLAGTDWAAVRGATTDLQALRDASCKTAAASIAVAVEGLQTIHQKAQHLFLPPRHPPALGPVQCPSPLDEKSRSTVNSPIFACRSLISSSRSRRGAGPAEKLSFIPSIAFLFQLLTFFG